MTVGLMNFSRKPRNARCPCCRSQKPRDGEALCEACTKAGCRCLIGDMYKRAAGCPLKARTSAAARKSWSNRRAP